MLVTTERTAMDTIVSMYFLRFKYNIYRNFISLGCKNKF